MEFFKNIALHLQATGPAAVIIVWILCITLVGIFGNGPIATMAMGLLAFAGGAVMIGLASRT
jgi:hypothetical protein